MKSTFLSIALASTLVALLPASASAATLYFNGAVNDDWATLSNWWDDAAFSDPAGALPTASDDAVVSAVVTSNSGEDASVSALTVTGYGTTRIDITVADIALFEDEAYMYGGTIYGDAVFYDNSYKADGAGVSGDATFNNSSYSLNGTIGGDATFNDESVNYDFSSVAGSATFNALTANRGPITDGATFNGSSANSGAVSGGATFNGDRAENYGSVAGGKIRRYTESVITSRNFLSDGPWTIVIDGPSTVVNLFDAVYDDGTTVTSVDGGEVSYDYAPAGSGSGGGSSTPSTTTTMDTAPEESVSAPIELEPVPEEAVPASEETVVQGEYIRLASAPDVYYTDVDARGTLVRRPFVDTQTFLTWADSFDAVRTVSEDTMAVFPMGNPMLPKAGVALIKIDSVSRVYVVEEGSRIRWIANEQIARDAFGAEWDAYVIDVSPAVFFYFGEGVPIESAEDAARFVPAKTRQELSGS